MVTNARYGDSRMFTLPDGWNPVADEVLTTALDAARSALADDVAPDRLARYYDRESPYAGTLFLDAQPNNPSGIDAADLYAVTTLSIQLDPRHGRLLLDNGPVREDVLRQLRNLDADLPITDLAHGPGGSAETLTRMYELHRRLKTLLDDGNRWVPAAKLSARKRPRLFPVRDNLVCKYLSGGRELKPNDGWPGDFSTDIQIFAYLATHPTVKSRLSWLRAELTSVRLDEEDLRLLDSALWMAANQ